MCIYIYNVHKWNGKFICAYYVETYYPSILKWGRIDLGGLTSFFSPPSLIKNKTKKQKKKQPQKT